MTAVAVPGYHLERVPSDIPFAELCALSHQYEVWLKIGSWLVPWVAGTPSPFTPAPRDHSLLASGAPRSAAVQEH